MNTKYTAAALAMTLAVVCLSQQPVAADPAFRITQKIYGYHKVGEPDQGVTTTSPNTAQPQEKAEPSPQPIANPGPAAEPAAQQPQPAPQPVATPAPAPEKAVAKKETKKPVKESAQQPTPAQPAEASEPMQQPSAGVPVAVPQQPAMTTDNEKIHLNTPVQSSSQPGLVKEAVHPSVNVETVNPPAQPEQSEEEMTPNTMPQDADNQPPHQPTPAEEAEALKPAKNEALFKEALTHYNEAIHLNQEGKFKEAVVEYQKALYIDPAMPDARVGLAVSYASLGQWQPMINELEMALQLKDMFLDKFNLVQAHYNLSAAYCVQQDVKKAHDELDLVKEAHHPNLQQLQMFIDSHCAGK